jgi:hypothetical protein
VRKYEPGPFYSLSPLQIHGALIWERPKGPGSI